MAKLRGMPGSKPWLLPPETEEEKRRLIEQWKARNESRKSTPQRAGSEEASTPSPHPVPNAEQE